MADGYIPSGLSRQVDSTTDRPPRLDKAGRARTNWCGIRLCSQRNRLRVQRVRRSARLAGVGRRYRSVQHQGHAADGTASGLRYCLPLSRLHHRQSAAKGRHHRPRVPSGARQHCPQLGGGVVRRAMGVPRRLHPRCRLPGQPAAPLPRRQALLRLRGRHAGPLGPARGVARAGHLHPEGWHRRRLRHLRRSLRLPRATRLQPRRPESGHSCSRYTLPPCAVASRSCC